MDKLDAGAFWNPQVYGGLRQDAKKTGGKRSERAAEKTESRQVGVLRFEEVLKTARPGYLSELGAPRELSPSEEAVRQLLDEVHSAGDSLRQRPFKEEVLAYKKAVRDFLHYVVENSYTTEDHQGVPWGQKPGFSGPLWGEKARMRNKFQAVKVVDAKLEQLAGGILSGQTAQLELLSKLEEITGLLVNLVIAGGLEVNQQ
jgi:uncharacterized protein YaaR (DUF327 family)